MKLEMRENSLFAVLLRSPWWYSMLIAAAIVMVATVMLGSRRVLYGVAVAAPFLVLAMIALYRQMQRPSARKVEATVEWVRSTPAREFARAVTAAYSDDGYQTAPFKGKAADLQVEKAGRVTLVSFKRAKAALNGIEPLRALTEAGEQTEAAALVYVALGELSRDARKFAASNGIYILGAEKLAEMIGAHVE